IQPRPPFSYELNHFFPTYLQHKPFHLTPPPPTLHTPNPRRTPQPSHISLYLNIQGTLYITHVPFPDLPTTIIHIGSKTQ
ncbi:arylamine N-acetyltransferase, partial [Staphylococcus epidermidis]|uniref:arylamine N-acetyltransferase n=1 Tax=Staphylococcus epidermidis TaxID=1282 RepID=UPI0011A6E663